jgi:S1-C subfamily serine protease
VLNAVAITEVASTSYLGKIGAEPGDIIRQIDDMPIHTLSDYNRAVVRILHKSSIVLLIQRADQLYHVTVKLSR